MSERRLVRADAGEVSAPILNDEEVAAMERNHPDGLAAKEVVQVFTSRGAKLSEATFRKYVQLGLLPRSRRVRRQGRRGGSQGLYPVSVVRRVIEIKQLLAQDFTMEEIRQKFLCATSEIDELEESLVRVFDRLRATLTEVHRTGDDVALLSSELEKARDSARHLTESLRGIERRLEAEARGSHGIRRVV
jgi:DNA-binding transcriptional MerR regulator